MAVSDWLWAVLGWGVAALGVGLVAWALCWDRSRGRRRCPKCWYDMGGSGGVRSGGVIGLVCPECGKRARNERALHRTRPRRWWAAVGVAVMIAGALTATVERDRAVRAVPLPVWAAIMPHLDAAAAAELASAGVPVSDTAQSEFARIRAVHRAGVALDLTRAGTVISAPQGNLVIVPGAGGLLSTTPGIGLRSRSSAGPFAVSTAVPAALSIIIEAPDLAALALPAVHRLALDPRANLGDREQCLLAIELLEGPDTARTMIERIMNTPGEPLRWLVLDRLSPRLMTTDDWALKMFHLALEHADGATLQRAAESLSAAGQRDEVTVNAMRRASLRAKDRIAQMALTAALDRLQGPRAVREGR